MITVSHVRKSYGDHVAVKDLSFSVEKGCIYGLLGANGAGKTTTLSILTGCLAPDSGSVSVDGLDLFERAAEAKKRIGYLPEVPPLYGELTPLEHLSFVCQAKQVPKQERDHQIRKVVQALSLKPVLHRLTKNLSKGYRQRVGLAAALLREPEVLILDEPMVGLDPVQIIEIRDLLTEYAKEHTVILSSHILSEVDRLCHRVLILSQGVLVAEDSPEALSERNRDKVILDLSVKGERDSVLSLLASLGEGLSVEQIQREEELLRLSLRASSDQDWQSRLFFAFARAELPIVSMNRRQISLEQIFLELSGEEEKESGKGGAEK